MEVLWILKLPSERNCASDGFRSAYSHGQYIFIGRLSIVVHSVLLYSAMALALSCLEIRGATLQHQVQEKVVSQ